jgi:hypothetical protein
MEYDEMMIEYKELGCTEDIFARAARITEPTASELERPSHNGNQK